MVNKLLWRCVGVSPLAFTGAYLSRFLRYEKEEGKYAPLLPCSHLCIQLVLWEQKNTFHSSLPAAVHTCPCICCLILRAGTPEQMCRCSLLLWMINRDFNAAHCRLTAAAQHSIFHLNFSTPRQHQLGTEKGVALLSHAQ